MGGCFFFAAATRLLLLLLFSAPLVVVVVVVVVAAATVVVVVTVAAAVVFANGVPCRCFGTSGRGFLGLRPPVVAVAVGVAEPGVLAAESLRVTSSPLIWTPPPPLTLLKL